MNGIHSFHIPVMGTCFTIDSAIKVGKYGIASVLALADDNLIEKMRRYYCGLYQQEYVPIKREDNDWRARRITAYLNLLNLIVKQQFEELKVSPFEPGSEVTRYFELLEDRSALKTLYLQMLETTDNNQRANRQQELRSLIQPGPIDVNIMTKLDRLHYDQNGKPLSFEYAEAHAALRGYANSSLSSSIIFSAGLNRSLFGYISNFQDFQADEAGAIKKKIVIKVSDYHSAYVQGKFLAKKGVWVSEYRIESGLNCGGHAFATPGYLLGPILEEFKRKKNNFIDSLFLIYNQARAENGKKTFSQPHPVRITAQGGVCSHNEHQLLLDYYKVDSVGWGTPFLLVPEASTVDGDTLEKLRKAGKDDLYLSSVSPLGVPFNNLRNSLSEIGKQEKVKSGKPGAVCYKGYLVSNTEFTKIPLCTASNTYENLKLKELKEKELDPAAFQRAYDAVVVKSCLCHGLAGGAVLSYGLSEANEPAPTPAVCPGPNLAYFSRISNLKEMVDHIYGRANLLNDSPRSSFFMEEFSINIEYLKNEIENSLPVTDPHQIKYFNKFINNLLFAIKYYQKMIRRMKKEDLAVGESIKKDLAAFREELYAMVKQYNTIFNPAYLSKYKFE